MLAEDMERYEFLRKQIRIENKKHSDTTKPWREEVQLLEASIRQEVLKAKRTIQFGNVKAEYIPTVRIMMKKDKDNE